MSYLGLELSPSSLKALVTANGWIMGEECVVFDQDFPEYNTREGLLHTVAPTVEFVPMRAEAEGFEFEQPFENEGTEEIMVTSPVEMWVRALDLLFKRMKKRGFEFASVRAISCSAQQHGTVYWKKGAQFALGQLDETKSLEQQLTGVFAVSSCEPTY